MAWIGGLVSVKKFFLLFVLLQLIAFSIAGNTGKSTPANSMSYSKGYNMGSKGYGSGAMNYNAGYKGYTKGSQWYNKGSPKDYNYGYYDDEDIGMRFGVEGSGGYKRKPSKSKKNKKTSTTTTITSGSSGSSGSSNPAASLINTLVSAFQSALGG
uniref:Putative secreted protein n=1 Tax=Lutzomyia longipalpis TaxID=7200 RepID=A0A1B0GL50_LUTLO